MKDIDFWVCFVAIISNKLQKLGLEGKNHLSLQCAYIAEFRNLKIWKFEKWKICSHLGELSKTTLVLTIMVSLKFNDANCMKGIITIEAFPTWGHYGLNNQARWVRVGLMLVWWETTKWNCPMYPQVDPLCWPNMSGAIHKIQHPPTRLLWYLIIQPKWTNFNVMEQAHDYPLCSVLLVLPY